MEHEVGGEAAGSLGGPAPEAPRRWTPQEASRFVRATADALAEVGPRLREENRAELEEALRRREAAWARAHDRGLSGEDDLIWEGPAPEWDVVGRGVVVVAQTDRGERVGRIVGWGASEEDGEFYRTAWLYCPSSGSFHEVPGRLVRLGGEADAQRLREEQEMAERLRSAAREAQRAAREERQAHVPGSSLVDGMLAAALARGLRVDDKTGWHQILGPEKRCVYLAKKGGRADLSGFCPDDPGVEPLSAEEARARHLGRVRGQVDFSRPADDVMRTWAAVLDALAAA